MRNSKRKHFFLILLIVLIAIFSVQYKMTRENVEKRNSVAVILPQNKEVEDSRIMDGIRDYAMNHDILLDVWYIDNITFDELETLIAEEEKNQVIGTLLVYPEEFLRGVPGENYDFDHVLAITDTMKDDFLYTATFEENGEVAYSLPIPSEVIEQLLGDSNQFIYIRNTYKLGYCSMEQMRNMQDICLEYMKVDGRTITNGEIDSLLIE